MWSSPQMLDQGHFGSVPLIAPVETRMALTAAESSTTRGQIHLCLLQVKASKRLPIPPVGMILYLKLYHSTPFLRQSQIQQLHLQSVASLTRKEFFAGLSTASLSKVIWIPLPYSRPL